MKKVSNIPPFGLRLDPEVRQQAEEIAKQEDRSLNWLLNAVIKMGVPIWVARRKAEVMHD
jgi:predicted HicB family RNase H-like nuclease